MKNGAQMANYLDEETLYFQYSSDTQLYTELSVPGIEENTDESKIIFWTGERDSLNNAKVGAPLNVPRDIGFTIVNKDLAIVTSTKYNGTVEAAATGQFYGTGDIDTAAGTPTAMSNAGNAWITNYQEELTTNSDFAYVINDLDADSKYADSIKPWKSATKLKNVKMANGDIFLLYEIWNEDSYQYTAYMIVDSFGVVATEETKICYPVRLHKSDVITTTDEGETVLIYEGLSGGFMNLYRIEKSSDPNAGNYEEGSISLLVHSLTFTLVAYFSLLV